MKKPCHGCGKQIPEAALHCVFCGAKQDAAADPSATAASSTETGAETGAETGVAATAAAPIASSVSSRANVTLIGIKLEDVQAAADAAPPVRADGAPAAPALDSTPRRGLPVLDGEDEDAPRGAAFDPADQNFATLVRLVMGSGGVVLIALFSLPWHGSSSWQLLETLVGVDFARQLFLLAGGAVLCATALLPVPRLFRAVIGASVATVPLVLGAASLLDGWRGLGAALAIIALPATHLLRTSGGRLDARARGLVVAAAAAVGLLYLVPVSSVVPLVYVGRMLSSAAVVSTVVGLFISIPLVLAALSLLGTLGRDLASVGVMLAVLTLLWPPAALLLFVDDGTQLYLALAILWTSATAALSLAQLLSLAASRDLQRA